MEPLTLYAFEDAEIKISILAYIDEATGDFVLDGYDIGPKVQKVWGDSDYEYVVRVAHPHKASLLTALGVTAEHLVEPELNQRLLQMIAQKFSHDKAFSDLLAWCKTHHIETKSFTWA